MVTRRGWQIPRLFIHRFKHNGWVQIHFTAVCIGFFDALGHPRSGETPTCSIELWHVL